MMPKFRPIKNLLAFFLMIAAMCMSGVAQSQEADKELARKILADSRLTKVEEMAKELLKTGFNAGDGYPQVWIRDMNTFIETSCDVYDTRVIRRNLITFLHLQQPNGEIVDGYVLKGHVGWDDPNTYTSTSDTVHVGFKNTVETDQETSLIQAIGKYIRKTGDRSILDEKVAGKTIRERLGMSIEYLLKNRYTDKYGLLIGATTQDWGDVQPEHPLGVDVDENTHWAVDIYDNAMFIIALVDMINFSKTPADKAKWEQLKNLIYANSRKYLWDSKNQKFIPHIYLNDSPFPANFDESAIHFHGGTAIAIEAGLLSRGEIADVNRQMVENVKKAGAPSIGLTIYPPYPEGFFQNKQTTKPFTYQNGGDWTWFGGRMIQQLIVNDFVPEAYDEISPMLDRAIKNKGFYEWYAIDGKPGGSGSFRGEAGVLAKAVQLLREWARQNK
jgi:hypothetical protein